MIDLERDEAIRRSATPGPWDELILKVWAKDHKGSMNICDIRGWGHLTGKGHGALALPEDEAYAIQKGNGTFIAHFNPEYVGELLAEIRRLREALEYYAAGHGLAELATEDASYLERGELKNLYTGKRAREALEPK